jgi:hypothetical protein
MLLATFFSPLIAAIFAAIIYLVAKQAGFVTPKVKYLVKLSLLLAAAGAVASLFLTIAWMIWYEKSTGYSAGNASLGWIFVYGPLSAAVGQILALAMWWFRKPRSWWASRDSSLAA